MVCSFEAVDTTSTSYSPVSRAIGVACVSVTGDLLMNTAETMPLPVTISALPSPLLLLISCARPIVPPAPPTLTICMRSASFAPCIDCPTARPSWS